MAAHHLHVVQRCGVAGIDPGRDRRDARGQGLPRQVVTKRLELVVVGKRDEHDPEGAAVADEAEEQQPLQLSSEPEQRGRSNVESRR